MSAFVPFGPVGYRPVQINPAQPPYTPSLTVPPQQQQGPLLSPQPGHEPPPQTQALVHSPNPGFPPASPFEWVLSSLTNLLNTQHNEITAKLGETADHQRALSAKVDTLQHAANEMRQTINALSTAVQAISSEVTRLGTDMSSRDATLASRLGALDDAIDAWTVDGRVPGSATVQTEALQTLPASDVQRPEAANPPAETQATKPEDNTLASFMEATMEPSSDGSSSPLSSPESSPQHTGPAPDAESLEMALVPYQKTSTTPRTPGRPKKRNNATQPDTIRRSSRPPKKRKQMDALVAASTSNKKLKPNTKPIIKKTSSTRFDWSDVVVRTEDLSQVVQCDSCEIWYHLGCVGIHPDDPILKEDVWVCPPCEFEITRDPAFKHRGRVSQRQKCRPDCKVDESSDEKFVIESIIGRYPHLADPTGRIMQYLIKWEDWAPQYSTWTPEEEVGPALQSLVAKFEVDATNEGLDISQRQALLLLQQATEAGVF